MVKRTQKIMVLIAAILLLLLAFGLGFYTYPLVSPLADAHMSLDSGTVPFDDTGLNGTSAGNAAQTPPAQNNADQSDTASTDRQVSGAEDSTLEQGEEQPQLEITDLDFSGVNAADLAIFLDAWRALDKDFYGEKPESRQQIYGAVRGLLQAYDDPYTFFIEPETNEVEQGNLRGSFGGIGANIQPIEWGFMLDPIRDNPAWKAGIQKGDLLVGIDEVEITAETPIDDVVAMIRGPLETDVLLDLLRPTDIDNITADALEEAEALSITVTRGEIKTPSMDWRIITDDELPVTLLVERLSGSADDGTASEEETNEEKNSQQEPLSDTQESDSKQTERVEAETSDDSERLPPGITEQDIEAWKQVKVGYIQHRIYSDRSPEEMRTAVEELRSDGADRFIIDLRGNPGGPVTAVVQVTDLWVEQPLIMLEEKADGSNKDFESSTDTIVTDEPIIIVVDGGSASASEIFAGALRDHDRALIVGEQTFGKGSVQVIHILPDSSSMHITNALWFTPDGQRIDGEGLKPDTIIEPGTDALEEALLQILGTDSLATD